MAMLWGDVVQIIFKRFIMRHWTGLLLLCLTATSVQADLVLARRGQPADTMIVHAADAPESIKLACNELQMYMERMTGVKLPI